MSGAAAAGIRFEPSAPEQDALLRLWLALPHVIEWWGDPDEEFRLIREARENGEAVGFIAFADGQPVGYVQSWIPADFEEPWAQALGSDTLGIDIFVAEPGRGFGPPILRAFAAKLFAEGAVRVVIDPDVSNARALRAYAKAGFKLLSSVRNGDGSDSLLLEIFPGALLEPP